MAVELTRVQRASAMLRASLDTTFGLLSPQDAVDKALELVIEEAVERASQRIEHKIMQDLRTAKLTGRD